MGRQHREHVYRAKEAVDGRKVSGFFFFAGREESISRWERVSINQAEVTLSQSGQACRRGSHRRTWTAAKQKQ